MENHPQWVWQHADWPRFQWNDEAIQPLLRSTRTLLGMLAGMTGASSGQSNAEAELDTLLQNIITSSAIEGESLNAQSVRSSLAKRLGLSHDTAYPTSERSEGLATTLLDAIGNLDRPLTPGRLFQWHHWLFPDTGFQLHSIRVGQLRGEEPMQVISGRIDRPTIHFEAPPRSVLEDELEAFLCWFNQSRDDCILDPLLRAGVCHFWFVTLHPFDDGNGRIVRTLTDLALAQADTRSIRCYAMSAAILARRNAYYDILESSQRGTGDITDWLIWFLRTLEAAVREALSKIERTLAKTRFWQDCAHLDLSAEQRKVLNRLLDGGETGFEHGISAAQYQKVAKVSKATATRHLADLLAKGCIEMLPGGGRSTRYQIRNSE